MEGLRRPLPDGQRREHDQGRRSAPRELGQSSPRPTATTWPASSRRSGTALEICYDDFIQTSEERHHAGCRKFIQTVYDAGDIYKKALRRAGTATAARRSRPRRSSTRRRRCPNHPTPPLRAVEEEYYFFRLSAFQDRLLDALRGEPRLHPAGEPAQRDRQPRRDRAAGRRHHPQGVHLGHPGPVRPGVDDLRLVRRPAELHHRASATAPTRRGSAATGRPTSTSSARTSPGSTAPSGRRC